jgi:hypothetical protein
MTAADEAAVTLARDEAAVALARDTVALLGEAVALLRDLAARNEAAAGWADDALAGGTAPKPVAYQLIDAARQTAAAARGEAAVI